MIEWAAAFTGPAAWSLHLLFNYGLEEFVTCAPGAHGSPTFLGLEVRQWVVLSNVVLAALTLGAGLLSLARYRRLRERDPSPGRVEEWMALAGIVLSALFFVIIAAGIAPAAILDACVQSP
jgi:hypothetical protein